MKHMNYGNWNRSFHEEADGAGSDLGGGDEAKPNDDTAEKEVLDDKETPDEIKLGDDDPDDKEGKLADDAPDTYEDFIVPDGMEMNQELLVGVSELFKADGLNQEKAQKYIDMYAKSQQEAGDALIKQHTDQVAEWTTALKSDNDIGGDKLDATLSNAKSFLKTHGTPELTKYLDDTGLSNNPELIRAFNSAGALLQEDNTGIQAPKGGTAVSEEQARLDRMYPEES